jgi:Bor protein
MRRSVFVLAPCLAIVLGCYTTTYVNFAPESQANPAAHIHAVQTVPQYWRSFWIYGWAPGEMRIDAVGSCGGIEHVEKIETEQTFVQGLIAAFAGYYINIYSPYSARVVCDNSKVE